MSINEYGQPTVVSFRYTVDGMTIDVPDSERCYLFKVSYHCGHHYRDIPVKQREHRGPCIWPSCKKNEMACVLPMNCDNCSS